MRSCVTCHHTRKSVFKEEVLVGVKPAPHCPPAKMSVEQKEAQREIINELATAGILVPYAGPAKCRVIMVEKPTKPGEKKRFRMVLDGRPVNATIKKLVYNGQDLRELLPRMRGYKWRSKLDLVHSYFQIPVEKDVIGRYTFEDPDGRRWAMTVQTMGAVNSMVALDNVLADIFGDFVASGHITRTADDFVVGSYEEDRATHERVLSDVLDRAKQHKLVFSAVLSEGGAVCGLHGW